MNGGEVFFYDITIRVIEKAYAKGKPTLAAENSESHGIVGLPMIILTINHKRNGI